MEPEILVAIISGVGTIAGSFFGIMASSKLTNYRLEQLENKVNKHNSVIERTYKLEGQMQEAKDDISELQAWRRTQK